MARMIVGGGDLGGDESIPNSMAPVSESTLAASSTLALAVAAAAASAAAPSSIVQQFQDTDSRSTGEVVSAVALIEASVREDLDAQILSIEKGAASTSKHQGLAEPVHLKSNMSQIEFSSAVSSKLNSLLEAALGANDDKSIAASDDVVEDSDDRQDGARNGSESDESSAFSGPDIRQGGLGRGRPLGGHQPNNLAEDPWNPSFGIGPIGRGKALAPPPGLQGLPRSQGSKSRYTGPGGLAQPWIPAPIPEDDEIDIASPLPALELPIRKLGSFDSLDSSPTKSPLATPWSKQASYIETPLAHWSKTPSPGSTPLLTREEYPSQIGSMSPMLTSLPPAADAGTIESNTTFAAASASSVASRAATVPTAATTTTTLAPNGVIPSYITVPLAMSHICPHCNKNFARAPGDHGLELQLQQALRRAEESQQQLQLALQRAEEAESARNAAQVALDQVRRAVGILA
jgi:hypothetical protein